MCKIMDISIGYALPILPVNHYLDKKESAFWQAEKAMPVVELIFIEKIDIPYLWLIGEKIVKILKISKLVGVYSFYSKVPINQDLYMFACCFLYRFIGWEARYVLVKF